MDAHVHIEPDSALTQPWNKGKLTGAKPPLSPKHVWAVRTRLQLLKRHRDLAALNSSAEIVPSPSPSTIEKLTM